MRIRTVIGVLAMSVALAACQTTSSSGSKGKSIAKVIAAGGPKVTVAEHPQRTFRRADGTFCQVLDFWQKDAYSQRHGVATVCLMGDNKWVLAEKKWVTAPASPRPTPVYQPVPTPPSQPTPYQPAPTPPPSDPDGWQPITN